MKTASDRFSPAEEGSVIADLLRAILLFIWCVVRIPVLIVLAFLEPFVRFALVGIAILSLLTGLVYKGFECRAAHSVLGDGLRVAGLCDARAGLPRCASLIVEVTLEES